MEEGREAVVYGNLRGELILPWVEERKGEREAGSVGGRWSGGREGGREWRKGERVPARSH